MSVPAFTTPPSKPGPLAEALGAMPSAIAGEAFWQVIATVDAYQEDGNTERLDGIVRLVLGYARASSDAQFLADLRRAREDRPRTVPDDDEERRIRALLGA